MHRRVYIPSSNSYSPVNYLDNIKLNRGGPSNLCSSAWPFIVDDVCIERSWGADVGVGRCFCASQLWLP